MNLQRSPHLPRQPPRYVPTLPIPETSARPSLMALAGACAEIPPIRTPCRLARIQYVAGPLYLQRHHLNVLLLPSRLHPLSYQLQPTQVLRRQQLQHPNAGIAIWLQQYSSTSGAEVGTWFAYTYTPGDAKLSDPCNSNSCGMTPVPDGTPVSDELRTYPDKNMTISAYNFNLMYELSIISLIGSLNVIKTDGLDTFLTSCNAVANAKSVACGSQYELTPRVTCEWVI